MESTLPIQERHYTFALPWSNEKATSPKNRPQTEKRLKEHNRHLEKDTTKCVSTISDNICQSYVAVAGEDLQATGADPHGTGANAQETQAKSQVTQAESQVTGADAQETQADAQVTKEDAEIGEEVTEAEADA